MSITTDPKTPCLRETEPSGQQKCYLVLSDDEIAKGFVRPVRNTYRHITCNTETRMGEKISETYAARPEFYSGTFCVQCGTHFNLVKDGIRQFEWIVNGIPDGSFVGE